MNVRKVVGIGLVVVATAGIGFIALLGDKNPLKYSDKWFSSLSDKELELEREKVRLNYISAGEPHRAVFFESILNQIDNIMIKREMNNYQDMGSKFPVHSEHGWYLSSDD